MKICGADLFVVPVLLSFDLMRILQSSTSSIIVSYRSATATSSSSPTTLFSSSSSSAISFLLPLGINTRSSDLARQKASLNENATIIFDATATALINTSSFSLHQLVSLDQLSEIGANTNEQSLRLGIQVENSVIPSFVSVDANELSTQYFYQEPVPSNPPVPYSIITYPSLTETRALSNIPLSPSSSIFKKIAAVAFANTSTSINNDSSSPCFHFDSDLVLQPPLFPPVEVTSWNDVRAWPHYTSGSPSENDGDAVITRGVTIRLSLDDFVSSSSSMIPRYRSIIVEGKLIIEEGTASSSSAAELIFRTSYFIVLGGTLEITSNTNPNRKVRFVMMESSSSSQNSQFCLPVPASSTSLRILQPGTFISFGTTNIRGYTPPTIQSTLRDSVVPTTTSTSVKLKDGILGWRHGDEVVLSSSSFDQSDTEIVKIDTSAVDPSTGSPVATPNNEGIFVTSASTPVRHEHLSLDQFASGRLFSAHVGLLSRNIIFEGANFSSSSSSCSIKFSSIASFTAKGILSGVRVDKCGRARSEPTILISPSSAGSSLEFNRVVVSNSFGLNAIRIDTSEASNTIAASVTIRETIVAFTSAGSSIKLVTNNNYQHEQKDTNTINIRLERNLVLGTRNSGTITSIDQDEIICSYDVFQNPNVTLIDNVAAGSDMFGFCVSSPNAFNGDLCDDQEESDTTTNSILQNDGNTAHSNVVGFFVLSSSTSSSSCTEISKPTAWHNSYSGMLIVTISSSSSPSTVIINQPQIHDNLFGIEAHQKLSLASSSSSSTIVKVVRGQFSGRNSKLAAEKSCTSFYQNARKRVNGVPVVNTNLANHQSSAIVIGSQSSILSTEAFSELWSASSSVLRTDFERTVVPILMRHQHQTSTTTTSSSVHQYYKEQSRIQLDNCLFSDYATTFEGATTENQPCSRSRILTVATIASTTSVYQPFPLSCYLVNSTVVYSSLSSITDGTTSIPLATTSTTILPSSSPTLNSTGGSSSSSTSTASLLFQERENVLLSFPSSSSSSAFIFDTDGSFFQCGSESGSSSSCVALSTNSELFPSAWEIAEPTASSCARYARWKDEVNDPSGVGGLLCNNEQAGFRRLQISTKSSVTNSNDDVSSSRIWIRSDRGKRMIANSIVTRQVSNNNLDDFFFTTISRDQSYTLEFRNFLQTTTILPSSFSLGLSGCLSELNSSTTNSVLSSPSSKTTIITLKIPPFQFAAQSTLWAETRNASTGQILCRKQLVPTEEDTSSSSVSIPLSSLCDEIVTVYQRVFAAAGTPQLSERIFSNDDSIINTSEQLRNIQSQLSLILQEGKSKKVIRLPNLNAPSAFTQLGTKKSAPVSNGAIAGIVVGLLFVIFVIVIVGVRLTREKTYTEAVEEHQVKTLAEIALQAQKDKEMRERRNNNNEGSISNDSRQQPNDSDSQQQNQKFVIYDNDGNIIDEDDFLAMFDEDNILGGGGGDHDDDDDFNTGGTSQQKHQQLGDSQFVGIDGSVYFGASSASGTLNQSHYSSGAGAGGSEFGRNGRRGGGRKANHLVSPSGAGLGTIRPMVFDAFTEITNEEEEIIDEDYQRRMRERRLQQSQNNNYNGNSQYNYSNSNNNNNSSSMMMYPNSNFNNNNTDLVSWGSQHYPLAHRGSNAQQHFLTMLMNNNNNINNSSAQISNSNNTSLMMQQQQHPPGSARSGTGRIYSSFLLGGNTSNNSRPVSAAQQRQQQQYRHQQAK